MKRTLKKLTAMLLVVSMVMSMVCMVPAFAEEGDSSYWQIAGTEVTDTKADAGDPANYEYYTVDKTTEDTGLAADYDEDEVNGSTKVSGSEAPYVEISKTIEGTGTENEFTVNLEVVTTQKLAELEAGESAAVVLVMDVSGSMLTQDVTMNGQTVTRIAAAQTAANDFLKSFVEDTTSTTQRWASLVTFAGVEQSTSGTANAASWRTALSLDTNNEFSSTIAQDDGHIAVTGWADLNQGNTLTNTISNISIDGTTGEYETNIYAGLSAAEELLDDAKIAGISNVYVVLLSDGAPDEPFAKSSELTFLKDYLKTPDGNSTSTSYYDATGLNIVYAYAAAESLKAHSSNPVVYSIGFAQASSTTDAKIDGESYGGDEKDDPAAIALSTILTNIASDTSADHSTTYFTASTYSSLTSSFDTIAAEIQAKANAWEVVDPMGDFISIDTDEEGQYSITGTAYEVVTDEETGKETIEWQLRNVTPVETKDAEGNDVYTYTLSYNIVLDTDDDDFAPNTYYLTNGVTSLEYYFVTEKTTSTGEVTQYDETARAFIYANVPAVKGVLPTYGYTINHWKEVADGTKEYNSKLYAQISSDDYTIEKGGDVTEGIINFAAYAFAGVTTTAGTATANTDKTKVTISVDEKNQIIDIYYNLIPTSVTVQYHFYQLQQTDGNDAGTYVEITGEGTADLLVTGLKSGTPYEYTVPTYTGYEIVTEDIATGIKEAGNATETIRSLSADASENVIDVYYCAEAVDDDRTYVEVEVSHIYNHYAWDTAAGEYTAPTSVTVLQGSDLNGDGDEETAYQVKGTSFTANEYLNGAGQIYDGYTYVENSITSNDSTLDGMTITSLSKDPTTMELTYEKYGETADTTTVDVIYEYQVAVTYYDSEKCEDVTEYIPEGSEYDSYYENGTFYVGQVITLYPAATSSYTPDDSDNEYTYTYTSCDPASETLTLAAEDDETQENVMVVTYTREAAKTGVTVNHIYTYEYEVLDEDGVGYTETFEETVSVSSEDDAYDVGAPFIASPVTDPEFDSYIYGVDGYKYDSTESTTAPNVTLSADLSDNVINIYYSIDDIKLDEDALVRVHHWYYSSINTYVLGQEATVPVTIFPETGETDRITGTDNEYYEATPDIEFTSTYNGQYVTYFDGVAYELVEELSSDLTGRMDGDRVTDVYLIYVRVADVFLDATVTVNYKYYTTTKQLNATTLEVEYVTSPDTGLWDTKNYPEEDEALYAGMIFTADHMDNGYTFSVKESDSLYLLVKEGDDNEITLKYYNYENSTTSASVKVIYDYTTYDIEVIDGEETRTNELHWTEDGAVKTNVYATQSYTADPTSYQGYNFDGTSETDNSMTITLVGGENIITVYYSKSEVTPAAATLTVNHVYQYELGTDPGTLHPDESLSRTEDVVYSWEGVNLGFYPDELDETSPYSLNKIESNNTSATTDLDAESYSITLNEDENTITITYYAYKENRDGVKVTVYHNYSSRNTYNNRSYSEGTEFNNPTVWLQEGTFTAELVEDHTYNGTDYTYSYLSGGYTVVGEEEYDADGNVVYMDLEDLTIDPLEAKEYVVQLYYERTYRSGGSTPTTPTTPDPDPDDDDDDDDIVIDIPDEDVPLSDDPTTDDDTIVTIPDEDVPLVSIPDEEVPLVEIPMEEIPLSDIPQTGDSRNVAFLMSTALLSALGLAWLVKVELDEKKKHN